MDRERLEKMSAAELEELKAEIEVLLAERRTDGDGGREVVEERSTEHGTLRREISTDADGSTEGPIWRRYYYANTKTGKRRLVSEELGPELPPEYRD